VSDREVVAQVENYARSRCEQITVTSGLWTHTQLVRKYALILANIEGINPLAIEIAALLHDIGKDDVHDRINHDIRGQQLAKEFLETIDLPQSAKNLILMCILKHRSRFAQENNPIEVKVLQCADALGTLFDDEWQEYSRQTMSRETIIELYNKQLTKINLESARKIAVPQIDKLTKLLI